jgi:CheY-like chemotaxis protein
VSEGRSQLVRDLLVASQRVLLDRLDTLDAAALHLLTEGQLDDAAAGAARRTAHQLISMSAFGVARGAELGARAEAVLGSDEDASEQGAELAEISAQLRASLLAALSESTPNESLLATAAPAPVGTAPDVLVVEDDAVLVELLERSLEGAGWTVTTVSDGPAAVAAVDVPPEQRPRLVLLDIDLPALDGFGVLRALRSRGLLAQVQVLCLTARASQPDVLSVLQLGAVDHVAKPFSLPVLLARVARALGRS